MNANSLRNAARLIAAGNRNHRVTGVAVNWHAASATLTVTYYVDGAPADEERELCELTAAELIAEFPDIASVRMQCLDGAGQAAEPARRDAWLDQPPLPQAPPAAIELALRGIFRLGDGITVLACATPPRGLPRLPAMATLCHAGQPRQAIRLQSRRMLGRPHARAGECALDTRDTVDVCAEQLRDGRWTLRLPA